MGLLDELLSLGKMVVTTIDEVRRVRDTMEHPDSPKCPRCSSRRTNRMQASSRATRINAPLRAAREGVVKQPTTLQPLPNSSLPNPPVHARHGERWSCSDCNCIFEVEQP